MLQSIKQIYTADDAALIARALRQYVDTLEATAKDLTDPDERYELNDVLLETRRAQTLIEDFE